MAITKIHAIKSTLGKALAYIENPDKTDGQMLVSGYNCEPQTASIDFEMTAVLAHKARNLKRKRSTNLAYHLIQSFSPEDAVTPEQAHELGKKLAFEYTGGKYEYVVATHIDKGHIHNHIMINAVSFYDYKKLRTVPYRTARQIRDISDRLCMGQRTTRAKLMSYFSAEALRRGSMSSTFLFQGSSLRITSVWSAAGCPWSLEKCGMRACSTFTKAISFSKRRRLTVPFLLRVKEPPLGVLASADNPVSHGASGFCRWKKQLRSVETGRTASARTI